MKRRFHSKDFAEYKSDNVVTVEDVKSIIRDYMVVWGKEKMEDEVWRWFEKDIKDEG